MVNGADRINEPDLARIRSLIDRIGWPMARDLVVAVSSIDRRDLLHHMTHREAATVKVALAVMAGDG